MMTRERFTELAEAYGGQIARWPAADRSAAERLLAADAAFAREALARAESLDAALDAWRPMSVGHELRERVVGAARGAVRRTGVLTWVWGAGAGAGLAAASAAGLIVGIVLSGQGSASASADEPVSAVMTSYEAPAQADAAGDAA